MTEIKDFLLVDVDGDSGDVHVETEEDRLLQSQINGFTGNQEEETEDVELYEEDKERTIGAGLLVGVLALPFGLVAGVLAGASAAYASTKPGATGDVCRAAGEVALVARSKATEVNNKHNLSEKSKEGAKEIMTAVQKANEDYHILERLKIGVQTAWEYMVEFENKHHVVEKTWVGFSNVCKNAMDSLFQSMNSNNSNDDGGANNTQTHTANQ